MEIRSGDAYRVVIRFPWGARSETETTTLSRDADGTLRWHCAVDLGVEPILDAVLQETETWVMGWAGGCCDVTVVISAGPGAPEP